MEEILLVLPDLYEDHKIRDQKWIEIAENCFKIQQVRKHYETLERRAFEHLKEISEGLSSKGGRFVYTCTFRKGSVDYAKIPELKSINLELYRKQDTQAWYFKTIG
jgi:hypothetical protein